MDQLLLLGPSEFCCLDVGLSITAEATVGNVHQQMWAKSGLLVKCSRRRFSLKAFPAKGNASSLHQIHKCKYKYKSGLFSQMFSPPPLFPPKEMHLHQIHKCKYKYKYKAGLLVKFSRQRFYSSRNPAKGNASTSKLETAIFFLLVLKLFSQNVAKKI